MTGRKEGRNEEEMKHESAKLPSQSRFSGISQDLRNKPYGNMNGQDLSDLTYGSAVADTEC
jgi:hypothetical protein